MDLSRYKVVLGSASPRRKTLFELLDMDVEIRPSNIEEVVNPGFSPSEVVLDLAKQKAEAIAINDQEFLITSDTVVLFGGKILGKPQDAAEAKSMLKGLSGNRHEVLSAVFCRSRDQSWSFYEQSSVYFKHLSEDEIDYYIGRHNPYDKAGAYGIQDWMGLHAVERIDGCFYNVMGFPVNRFLKELDKR